MLVPRFHLITPAVPMEFLRVLVHAGVDAVQVRDKSLDDRALLDLVRCVVDHVRPLGARVIVNDRVDIALAAEADGVHLGADDLPVACASDLAPGLLIGATCRTRDDVTAARVAGAGYAGFGPVAVSTTKGGLPEPRGIAGLQAAAGPLPLVAVGGLTAALAEQAVAAGAHGVAVSAAVLRDSDPPGAVRRIATALSSR